MGQRISTNNKQAVPTTAMKSGAASNGGGHPSIDLDQLYSQGTSRRYDMTEEGTNLFLSPKNDKKLFEQRDLNTSVPFGLYTVANPNMRNISKDYFKSQPYSKWTETKLFDYRQVQEVICTEYPDQRWTIDQYNRDFLKVDINNALSNRNPGFSVSLELEGVFSRKLPEATKESKSKQYKVLNYTDLDDCITAQRLLEFATFDCSLKENKHKSVTIPWSQAYNPNLILGQSSKTYPIIRKVGNHTKGVEGQKQIEDNQKHDVLLEFRCPDRWLVRKSKHATRYTDKEKAMRVVDPATCRPLTKDPEYRKELERTGYVIPEKGKTHKYDDLGQWTRLQFTLFSMLVSGSIFATYSVGTFYGGIVYLVGGQIRLIFLFGTQRAFIYEITKPMALIRLIEACYMYRHEQDLYREEETYRMLQEILRSPGLIKALTGSTLKGSADPTYDSLPAAARAKLEHLEKLERKGLEVAELRVEILKKHQIDDLKI